MSAPAIDLQRAVFQALTRAPVLRASINGRVYDRVSETPEFPYVSFGATQSIPFSADCITGGDHFLQIDVWSRAVGSVECKDICHTIKQILDNSAFDLSEHALADLRVESVRIMRDPDGLTTHGIISVEAFIEEK